MGRRTATLILLGVVAAILIAGASITLALPALAHLFPHDPSSCGGA